MRKLLPLLFAFLLLMPAACVKSTGTTVRVVKPKYHHSYYNHRSDKRTKRTKLVKVQN